MVYSKDIFFGKIFECLKLRKFNFSLIFFLSFVKSWFDHFESCSGLPSRKTIITFGLHKTSKTFIYTLFVLEYIPFSPRHYQIFTIIIYLLFKVMRRSNLCLTYLPPLVYGWGLCTHIFPEEWDFTTDFTTE